MQRRLESLLTDDLYHSRQGSTDSELLFLLLLQFGLSNSVDLAFTKVISLLESMRKEMSISAPLRIAAVVSNGERLFALRYASDQHSRGLYYSKQLDNGGIAVDSEPLGSLRTDWVLIAPSCVIEVTQVDVLLERAISLAYPKTLEQLCFLAKEVRMVKIPKRKRTGLRQFFNRPIKVYSALIFELKRLL